MSRFSYLEFVQTDDPALLDDGVSHRRNRVEWLVGVPTAHVSWWGQLLSLVNPSVDILESTKFSKVSSERFMVFVVIYIYI